MPSGIIPHHIVALLLSCSYTKKIFLFYSYSCSNLIYKSYNCTLEISTQFGLYLFLHFSASIYTLSLLLFSLINPFSVGHFYHYQPGHTCLSCPFYVIVLILLSFMVILISNPFSSPTLFHPFCWEYFPPIS